VDKSQPHITRLTQALSTVTSIFRCQGLQHTPSDADGFGFHDIAWWLIFIAILGGWFVFLFGPQRERLNMLDGRREVLVTHLSAERRELKRLESSISALTKGDPTAWERAARARLGWLEPGETTDLSQQRLLIIQRRANEATQTNRSSTPPPVLPRPAIPPVPSPMPVLRQVQQIALGEMDALGPTRGLPPPPPPLIPPVPIPPTPPPAARNTRVAPPPPTVADNRPRAPASRTTRTPAH
jgi:hypothetical protein